MNQKTFQQRFPMFCFYVNSAVGVLNPVAALMSMIAAYGHARGDDWVPAIFFIICFFGFLNSDDKVFK